MSSISATSAAENAITSRNSSTARCCRGRYCSPAMKASRTPSRDTATDSGSSTAVGTGCTQVDGSATTGGSVAVDAGGPSPDGSARRCRCSSDVKHTLVAIRYSHTRTDDR